MDEIQLSNARRAGQQTTRSSREVIDELQVKLCAQAAMITSKANHTASGRTQVGRILKHLVSIF